MENNSNLQANYDDNQSNSTVNHTNAMQVVGILGDPPKPTPGGRIQLEQEGNEEEKKNIRKRSGGRENDVVVRGNVEEKRKEKQIEGVKTALERAKYETIIWNLAAVVLGFVLGFEGGNARNGVKPIEEAAEGHEIVGCMVNAEGCDCSPSEDCGGGQGNAGEEKALKGKNN